MTPLKQIKDITIESSGSPAEAAGHCISDLLAVHHGRPLLLMLAGGSALAVLNHINPQYLGSHITVTVTDERFTDDILENNFSNLQSTSFYNDLISVDAFCIDTQIYGDETITGHSERFEKNINDWRKEFPKGIIVALYGIGQDGHIAGIIPGIMSDDDFAKRFDGDRFVAHLDAGRKSDQPLRVTTTFPLLRIVDFPLLYVRGEEKRDVLEKALAKEGSLAETPARIIQEMKSVFIFTDIEDVRIY
ncbi:MAG: 6-phosphogluconolactonase [Patescibacteria group bacterium]